MASNASKLLGSGAAAAAAGSNAATSHKHGSGKSGRSSKSGGSGSKHHGSGNGSARRSKSATMARSRVKRGSVVGGIGTLGATSRLTPSKRKLPDLGVLKGICMLIVLGSATTLLFGRGLVAIAQGVIGVLAGLEGFFGARKFNRKIVGYFLLYLIVNSFASVAIGVTTLNGLDSDCATARTPETCRTTNRMYGMIMLTGSSSIGALFSIITYFMYRRVPRSIERVDLELDRW